MCSEQKQSFRFLVAVESVVCPKVVANDMLGSVFYDTRAVVSFVHLQCNLNRAQLSNVSNCRVSRAGEGQPQD